MAQMLGQRDPVRERPAVFLDRDGTIMQNVSYLCDPDGVELLDGAAEALALLRQRGFALVIVSNQSGIGRGLLTFDDLASVHDRLMACLAERDVELDGVYYCPHAPWERCECRKPLPGLLLRAARELRLDLRRSFMVGDAPSDIEAGRRAGCRTILVTWAGPSEPPSQSDSEGGPHAITSDLLQAAYWILGQRKPGNDQG